MRRLGVLVPVVVGLLVVVLLAAEVAVRLVAAHEVSSAARRELGTSSTTLHLGSTPVLLDLARNRVDTVRVTASDAQLCTLPGVDLAATFHDLTLRGGHHVSATDARVTVTADGLTRLVDEILPAAAGVSVTTDPAHGTLALTLGPGGSVKVAARPTLEGSRLTLRPDSVTLLGQQVSASTLDRFTGGTGLSHDLSGLPLGLRPTSATVTKAGLSLALRGGAASLDQVSGTC